MLHIIHVIHLNLIHVVHSIHITGSTYNTINIIQYIYIHIYNTCSRYKTYNTTITYKNRLITQKCTYRYAYQCELSM